MSLDELTDGWTDMNPSSNSSLNPNHNLSLKRLRNTESKKVYVWNLPYYFNWKDLKALFVKEVGDVKFAISYKNDKKNARGCGSVEFGSAVSVQKAIDKMNLYQLNGRTLIVKDDKERCFNGHLLTNGFSACTKCSFSCQANKDVFQWDYHNTYGLSPKLLDSLGICGPLHNRVFVSNIDYETGENKIKEMFGIAGRLLKVNLLVDQEKKSKGCAVIHYTHPVEAVRAIYMFNKQILNDRVIFVRLDHTGQETTNHLQKGLKTNGLRKDPAGDPLHFVKTVKMPSHNISPMTYTKVNTTGLAVSRNVTDELNSESCFNIGGAHERNDVLKKISRTIEVKNLPPATTVRRLMDYFSHCGGIEVAEVTTQRKGIVRFFNEYDAYKAINLKHLSRFGGATLEVTLL